jgi:hypothetical protein
VNFGHGLIAAALILSGCATTKQMQVQSALLKAGVPQTMAECMAEPLARDLSTAQLRSLSKVAKAVDTPMSGQQALDLLKRDVDPETVGVVVRAGVGCLLRG